MADAKAAKDEGKKDKPKKEGGGSKIGLILAVAIASLIMIGGSIAGAVIGAKMLAQAQVQVAQAPPPEPPPRAPAQVNSARLDPIVIDLRAKDGTSHHLKVGMSAELMDGVEVETFDKLAPRGRSMALVYLRNLSYEEVTDPTQYERIAKELTERMKEALGDTVVHRIHIVDYVAQ